MPKKKLIPNKARRVQFKSEKNLILWRAAKRQRDAHLKLRLYLCGDVYFGWLRPDEILTISGYDIRIDDVVWLQASDDAKCGIATLRPVYFLNTESTWFDLGNIIRVEHIPPEVWNYDRIKNWWHGFSTPGAHLWRKNVW